MLRPALTQFGTWTAHPAAFVIVAPYGFSWAVFGHFDWHAGATLATWLMTLIIQRAEHRDTQAIQAKLDEIIRATGGARNELASLTSRSRRTSNAIGPKRTSGSGDYADIFDLLARVN